MDLAEPQRIDLPLMMADKAELWAAPGRRAWPAADPVTKAWSAGITGAFVFTPEFDIISSMTKARQFGFHDVV